MTNKNYMPDNIWIDGKDGGWSDKPIYENRRVEGIMQYVDVGSTKYVREDIHEQKILDVREDAFGRADKPLSEDRRIALEYFEMAQVGGVVPAKSAEVIRAALTVLQKRS